MLLDEVVTYAATARPDATALVAGAERWSFAELDRQVRAMATGVAARSAEGDRVVVVADNTPAYVAALYAVPAAGAVLAVANTRHSPAEVAAMARSCGATLLLGDEASLERLAGQDLPAVSERLVLDDPGWTAPGAGPGELDARRRDPGEVAWLIHTSGTTGRAKGAMLTHRSIHAAVLNTTVARPVADDEVYLFPFPLFHVAAYNVVHHHLRRRPVVLLARFDAMAVMAAIESEQVTSVSLAPTMLAMLLDHPERDRFELSSLRTVSYGASAMPFDLLQRVTAEWPEVGLAQGYGMTELSGNAVFLGPEEHRLAATTRPELAGAAGRPGPLVRLRIVDDSGAEVPPGAEGEILVAGDQVCAGYWGDPVATAEAMGDGWLRTGDVGRIDAEGRLHVVDRRKDIIITGGENVSSREVEDALGTHPALSAVAVVAAPHDVWGEMVCAVVVLADDAVAPDPEDLRTHAPDLAGFKHPKAVVAVEVLPVNASGKVDKVALRALAAERLSAERLSD